MKTMTFNLPLPPSIPSSVAPPPSIMADLFHFLNDFFSTSLLLQSLCSHSRAPAWACGRRYALWQVKWKPREISSSYKRSEAFSQSKIYIYIFSLFLSEATTDGRKKATGGKKVGRYLKTIWGFPLSTVNHCCSFLWLGGRWGTALCIHLQSCYCMSACSAHCSLHWHVAYRVSSQSDA